MEFVVGLGVSIVTEIGKYSIKPIIHHVGYLFRFNNNVKELEKAKKDLISNQEQVQADVERAALNTEVVKKNVETWLNNVKEVVEDVETLENKIKANKGCCNGWCPNWIRRYTQSKEATEKIIAVKALKDIGNFTQVAHRAPTPGIEIFSSSDFEVFESRKLAFDQTMEALDDDNCSSIGVWGMGGVGKTTLVKEVSKKAKELKLFNDIVMAVVSQPLDIPRIQKEIGDYLNLELKEESASGRARRICLRIKEAKKILIILDDIWKEINFEDIGIPSCNDHKGCKILITTRSEHVCNVMSCEKKVKLKVMTKEESLALFKKSARIEDDSLSINDDVVCQVVKECQGLPIAIVVVGKALINKSLKDWEAALDNLRKSKLTKIEGVREDENAYLCLKWSYDHLKPNTKLCFLLCSLFPEDHNIYIEELIIYVIGLEEEYEEVKSNTEEVRRQVYAAINSLKDSSLLLDSGGKDHVKMHDVVRDVALWIASKGDNEFSMRAITSLKGIRKFESVTAISLWANNAKQFKEKLVCPKLNILLLGKDSDYNEVKNEELAEISDTMFEGMEGLKILSLRNKFLSSQSLQFLTNLRSLYLVNCKFHDLSSLGKLESLEILSFCSCQMVALPNELGGLNNLKVLQLLGHCELKRIPPIQALSQLEELRVDFESFKNWEVEGTSIERRNASISELMSLSNLAVLYLTIEEKSLPIGFVFPELRRYNIYVGIGYTKDYSQRYERFLRFTKVNASSSFNVFNVLFCTVEVLQLEDCQVQYFNDTMGGINNATFSNLVQLTLWNCRTLTNLFSLSLAQNLKKLDTLLLVNCSELKQIISEEEMLFKSHHIQCFPKLRILEVINCEKMQYFFSIAVARGFLHQLEKLIIRNLPELKQVFGNEREGEVGLDENKFELSKLRKLSLKYLPKLSNFFQGNTSSTWLSLEELSVMSCPKLTPSFVADLIVILQAVEKKYVISIGSYSAMDYSNSRVLRLVDADAASMNVFKVFFYTVEVLELEKRSVESFIDTIGGNNIPTFSNLVILKLNGCNRLTNLFSPSFIKNLEKLETFELKSCSELKQIISEEELLLNSHIQPECFPKLRTLNVIDCGKLEYLFSISIARGFLVQLEKLQIEDLPELKQVFGEEREADIGLDGDKFELSKLKKLSLHKLPKLSSFCQGNISSTWPSLEMLSLTSCPKMTPSFGADLAASLEGFGKEYTISSKSDRYSNSKVLILDVVDASSLNAFKVFFSGVEVLQLSSCGIECFDNTIGGNNTTTFSNLDNLMLRNMPSLRILWEGPIQQTTFRNLTFLRVYCCSELTTLLPLSLCQNLGKLETLVLQSCSELKQIISEEKMLFNSHIQPKCFPKLRTLEVIDCGKLEYLCSILVARRFLLQLKELKIDNLLELIQVFDNEREADIGLDGDKFELSELTKLSLHKLPKLSSFCQGNISSTLPSLETLSVTSCPKMTLSFGVDLAASLEGFGKKYTISSKSDPGYYSDSNVLILDNVNASSLNDFKVFFYTVGVLELTSCEIECFNDTVEGNNTVVFSNLDKLTLRDMPCLRTLWEGPIQQTTFRNLTFLRVYNCSELTNLFPVSLCQNLEKLKTFELESCSELKQIISEDEMLFKCHIQPECFQKLRTIKVIDCGKLEYFCSISVARRFLLQLEELIIEDLPELKQVFGNERESDIGFDGNKFELPELTKLSLHKLPKMSSFCQDNISSTWPSLERLSVKSCQPSFVAILEANVQAIGKKLQEFNVSNCSQLCNTVLDLLTQGLLDLKELEIESCEGLEDLFPRERLLPSSLKLLRLKDLLVQRCVWKGPTQLVNLNNLIQFEVFRCNRLKQLFSPATLARSLQQLISLTIEECDELEYLIAKDEEDQVLSEGHPKPLYLPKLEYVFVKECNKMKSLFPITMVHSLQNLVNLKVEGAFELVEVFAHENKGDVRVRKNIKFSILHWLTLKHLPSLVSFCPRNYHFILSSLSELKVISCPNMSTSFACTPCTPNCFVQVNGEVAQSNEKDEPTVLSTTHEVVAARPTTKDIDWDRCSKRDALPIFKEEPPKWSIAR